MPTTNSSNVAAVSSITPLGDLRCSSSSAAVCGRGRAAGGPGARGSAFIVGRRSPPGALLLSPGRHPVVEITSWGQAGDRLAVSWRHLAVEFERRVGGCRQAPQRQQQRGEQRGLLHRGRGDEGQGAPSLHFPETSPCSWATDRRSEARLSGNVLNFLRAVHFCTGPGGEPQPKLWSPTQAGSGADPFCGLP